MAKSWMTMQALEQIQDGQCTTALPSMVCRARGRSLRWPMRHTVLFVALSSTLLWAAIIYTGWLVF